MTEADGHMGVIGLRVPGAIGYRHLAIRLVSTACKMALESELDGVDPNFEPEVVSAFGEAFNNVAVHGYRDLPAAPVQIEVGWDSERLVITMIDTGRTFDPDTVAPPNLDDLPESGMGIFIMKACMDEVEYRPGPPNVLRLVKVRRSRDGLLPPDPFTNTSDDEALDPMDPGVISSPEPDSAVITTMPAEDGDRGSHVTVVHAPEDRAGHSTWRSTATRPGGLKEISRRK